MKNELEKKEYCRPEMEVVAFSQQSYVLSGSPDPDYDDTTGHLHSPADTRIG